MTLERAQLYFYTAVVALAIVLIITPGITGAAAHISVFGG